MVEVSHMSMELFKAFMKKIATYETCALTEDELDLITGGNCESAIQFLESYCWGIPLDRQRKECEEMLLALKSSF